MKNEKRKEKKVKNSIFALLAVICCLFIVMGCENPAAIKNKAAPIPARKGSFSLAVSSVGRTIQPNTPVLADFAAYTLAFTPTDGGTAESVDRTNANLSGPIILDVGTYNLTVSAFKDNGRTQLMARGTASDIVITNGPTSTTRTVTLEALLSGNTGTFRWNITLETGISATMKITPASAGGTAEQTVPLSPSAATLISGQYTITFTLSKAGEEPVEWHELLYVYQNLESVFTHTFTGDYFVNTPYTVTYHYNDGVTANLPQSVLHGAALNNQPTRFGYDNVGWYTDNGTFNTQWNFATLVVESFDLYAQWNRRGYAYTITGNGTDYTATNGGFVTGTVAEVISAIRADADGNPCTIQFGSGGNDVLDIGAATASFNNDGGTWGLITLTGNITSANATGTEGTIATAGAVAITSTANIANTANDATGRAMYHNSTGTLTISGGEVSATVGRAVHNQSTGAVTISGSGMVSAITESAVYNQSNSNITISDNAVVTSARTTGNPGTILKNNGTLVITGGTVSNTSSGHAVYNMGGTVTISSGIVSSVSGCAVNQYMGSIEISGGTVSSASGNAAVYFTGNGSTSDRVTISGGTVEAQNIAVYNYNRNFTTVINLRGNPTITGVIYHSYTSRLDVSGTPTFNPGNKVYTIRYNANPSGTYERGPVIGAVAVTGGASFSSNFVLDDNLPSIKLEVSGNNLVIAENE